MSDGIDEKASRRRMRRTLLWGVPMLCLLLATCGGAVVLSIPGLKDKNLPPDGGGRVLVEAPESTCWTLSAYDERHPDGSKGAPDDEVASSEVDDLGLEPLEAEGCGPGEVVLPDDQVFGSVTVFHTDDSGKTHPLRGLLLTVWLTRRATRLTSAERTYNDGFRYMYAANAGDRSNPVPRLRALRVANPGLRAALQRHGFDPDGARNAATASYQNLAESRATEVDTYRRLVRQARHDAEVALQLVDIADRYLLGGFPQVGEHWGIALQASLDAFADAVGPRGPEVAAALREIAYERQEAAVRQALDDGNFLANALEGIEAMRALRPRRTDEINVLRSEITSEIERQEAEERAEIERQEAEDRAEQERLDELLSGGGGGGGGGGLSCDGDGDGICYE